MRHFFWIVLLLIPCKAITQHRDYKHFSSWNTLAVKANLSEKMLVKSEVKFRKTNFLRDWEQIVLRPSIHYKINPSMRVGMGYTYAKNFSYSDFSTPISVHEHNIWQQLALKQAFNSFTISHRFRFEERLREAVILEKNQPTIAPIRDYSNRLRYRFSLEVPLLKKPAISTVAFNEIFLDFEKQLQPQKLDQNWMFLGLRFRTEEIFTLTSGYHYINIPRGNSTISNHIWETTLIYIL